MYRQGMWCFRAPKTRSVFGADFELFDFELTDEEMKKIQVPVDEQK